LAAPRTLREPDGRWDAAVPDAEVDAVRARVLDLLSPTAIPRDELARSVGAPAAVVFAALVELALSGQAELLPGGMVARA
ncbi:DNA-protecting protein DprA, partial [Caulobacter sp. 17J65-9]|nr:DNA-protecting protein DprA [Caulobacter sp. 17J65-9]